MIKNSRPTAGPWIVEVKGVTGRVISEPTKRTVFITIVRRWNATYSIYTDDIDEERLANLTLAAAGHNLLRACMGARSMIGRMISAQKLEDMEQDFSEELAVLRSLDEAIAGARYTK